MAEQKEKKVCHIGELHNEELDKKHTHTNIPWRKMIRGRGGEFMKGG